DRIDRLRCQRGGRTVHLAAPRPEVVAWIRAAPLRGPAHRALEGMRVRGRERGESDLARGQRDHCRMSDANDFSAYVWRGQWRTYVARTTGAPSVGAGSCPIDP